MSDKQAIDNYVRIISRSSDYERKITSIIADPINIDSYGGSIRPEVIRNASDAFMEHFQNYGVDHVRDENGEFINQNDKLILLENWTTRNDQHIDGSFVPKGAWIQTWRVRDDDIWDRILRNEYTGFSFVAIAKKAKVD